MEKLKQTLSVIAAIAVCISVYQMGFTKWNILLIVFFVISLLGQWATKKKKDMLKEMSPEKREELEKLENDEKK